MIKVQVLTNCKYCNGEAYLPVGEEVDYTGERYMRYQPCPACEGSGIGTQWISLKEFAMLLNEALQAIPYAQDHQEILASPLSTINTPKD